MIAEFFENPLEVFPKVDVNVIKETLTRMGVLSKNKPVMYPSCYLMEDEGRWFVFHFKEIFRLINRKDFYNNMTEEDYTRKKSIVFCLKSWGLLDAYEEDITPHNVFIDVIPHNHNYEIKHKIKVNALDNLKNTLNVLEDMI